MPASHLRYAGKGLICCGIWTIVNWFLF